MKHDEEWLDKQADQFVDKMERERRTIIHDVYDGDFVEFAKLYAEHMNLTLEARITKLEEQTAYNSVTRMYK